MAMFFTIMSKNSRIVLQLASKRFTARLQLLVHIVFFTATIQMNRTLFDFLAGPQSQHWAFAVFGQSRHGQDDGGQADGRASVRGTRSARFCWLLTSACRHSLGITARKDMVHCTAKDLIGKYVGATEDLVKAKLQEARGGVLLIDEVWSLCR